MKTSTGCVILSIGDELVLGQTVDTNSAWISRELAAVGCAVTAHLTVGDDQPAIEAAIRDAAEKCDFLLISGGLGPTEDDLTRQALAAVIGQRLEENELWTAELRKFFEQRGRTMPPMNRIQAMIPRTASMIFNTAGTASGIDVTLTVKGAKPGSCRVFAMPGVPKEMKIMFARDALPHIQQASGGAVILSRTLHTFGLGESAIAEKLGDLMRRNRNPSVGTTVSAGVVSLRVNARFPSLTEAREELERTVHACRTALSDLIYGEDDQTLVERVAALLGGRAADGKGASTVATAESCTGGLLAKYLTDQPGSSSWFSYGWVTYANQAKIDQLGVSAELIAQHGAVSEPVAEAMAQGAPYRSGAGCAPSRQRHRRPRRRHAGEAGRHRLHRPRPRRRRHSPDLPLLRRPRNDPRPLGKNGSHPPAIPPPGQKTSFLRKDESRA